MSTTVIIAHQCSEDARSIEARLTGLSDDLVILLANSSQGISTLAREQGCDVLLMDCSLAPVNIADISLKDDSLILLLAGPEQEEGCAGCLTDLPWPCDIVNPAVPATVLQQKLQFLKRLRQVSQERETLQEQIDHLTKKVNDAEQALVSQQHYLDILAERDGLTGLYNRKHLTKVLQKEFKRAKRYETELSLLLLDIDNFGEINRHAGQLYGDFILNEMAARLTSNTRDSDVCFRFGGGNFIVLLPQSNILCAHQVADKLRQSCEDKKFDNGQISRHVTISVGVASVQDSRPEAPDQLIHMADKAMYQAKAEGRNRCRSYVAEEDPDHLNSLSILQETLTRMLEKTRNSSISSIELLARNLGGEKDQEHIEQARRFIEFFSRHLNLSKSVQQILNNSLTLSVCFRFLLHRDLISKQDVLTEDERKLMEDLPYKLVELTQLFDYFSQERRILLCHREWFNGCGYPEGLSGDEIPVGAKIFNLADALAAMTTDRPYRKRLEPEQVLQELEQGAGRQWDPQLVLLILDIIEQEQILPVPEQLLAETRSRLLNRQD